jgi:hypothetical protein
MEHDKNKTQSLITKALLVDTSLKMANNKPKKLLSAIKQIH